MGRVGRFILGGVLIGASFALPGIGVALSAGMKAALLSTGLSFSSNAIFEMMAGTAQRQNAIELNNPDNQAPLPVVYGATKLGLRLSDMRVGGTDNKFLYIVGALCHGSSDGNGIHEIANIYFDDELAISAAGVVQGRFAGKVTFTKYIGTDLQVVDPTMAAAFPAEYPASSKGRGVAYLMMRLEADPDVFPTGIPQVTAIVYGCKVNDLRVGGPFVFTRSGVPDPGRNPALALYDYLTSARYGHECSAGELDTASFIAMANYYDETVTRNSTLSTTGPRFQVNGWLDVGQLLQDNVKQLLTTCRGNLILDGGKYRLFTRRVVTPTSFMLTEHNIVGNWRIRTPSTGESPNVLRYNFVDPGNNDTYATETRYWPRPGGANAYLTEDNNYRVTADAVLPMTVDPYMAEQIALVTLKEQRGGIVVELTATEEALQLQVGDLTPVKHATPGWTTGNDLIWIMGMFLLPTGQIRIVGLRYNADAYTLDALVTHPSRPATSLPNPFVCQAPGEVDAIAGDAESREDLDGTHKVFIRATWGASPDPYLHHYEVQFRRSGSNVWQSTGPHVGRLDLECEIGPVTEGLSYDVQVRAVNQQGVPSNWVGDSVTPTLTIVRPGSSWIEDCSRPLPGRRWTSLSETGTFLEVVDPDAMVGGKVGRMTGLCWHELTDNIPFDPNLMYVLRFRVRQLRDSTPGKGKAFYLGLTGILEDGNTHINVLGQLNDNYIQQHFVCANGETLPAGRTFRDYIAFVRGYAGGPVALTASQLVQSGLGNFNAANLVDGDTTPTKVGFDTDAALAGAWLRIDFATPKTITEARLHMAAAGSAAIWEWEFADNTAGPWTTVQT